MTKRRKYTREFKLEALELLRKGDRTASEVAEALGIDRSVLSGWKRQYEEEGSLAFRGHGVMKPEDQELRDLKKKLAQVEEERDILKKALAYFAKERK